MKACPAVRVRVEGHTDTEGELGRNQRLSDNRAKAVADFLAENGIASNRVVAVGYGQTRPIVPNDSDRNRARNRRIDFVIVE
jgi:OmpA-OmpF porin, OOP family